MVAVARDYDIRGFVRDYSLGRVEVKCEGTNMQQTLFRGALMSKPICGLIRTMWVAIEPIDKYHYAEEFHIKAVTEESRAHDMEAID